MDSTHITGPEEQVTPRKLWFGFAASAAAWIGLGIADTLITWMACIHEERYGGARSHPGMFAWFIVMTIFLFLIAIASGVMSYRNWRKLADEGKLMRAEATGRREFMAWGGTFVCLTLGLGIIWLAIPIAILSLCVRAR